MKSSFLICGYPRSRTMWLSKFLSVPGISVCTHEACEFAGSAGEFWDNAERYAPGDLIYGNSDSANVYVLPALLAERPMTKVLWIERDLKKVAQSMRAAGMPFEDKALLNLEMMRELHQDHIDMSVDFDNLIYGNVCHFVWEFCLPGVPWDWGRWGLYADQKICYSREHPTPEKQFHKFLGWVQRELDEIRKERHV